MVKAQIPEKWVGKGICIADSSMSLETVFCGVEGDVESVSGIFK